MTVTNSIISNNTATSAGGIDVYGGTLTVNNSTISGNHASRLGVAVSFATPLRR